MHLVDVNVRLDWRDTSAKIASISLVSCLQKAGHPGASNSAKVRTRHVSRLRIYGGGEASIH
jgi:hypothetical protein